MTTGESLALLAHPVRRVRWVCVFERFTDRALAAVVQAEREAVDLGHPRLGTEHVLLGLTRDTASVGGRALSSLGVTYDDAQRRVAAMAAPDGTLTSRVVFSARAKQLLEVSVRTSLQQAHTRIGTSDLTLALLAQPGSTARCVLEYLGVDLDAARARVLEHAAATPTLRTPSTSSERFVSFELSPEVQALLLRMLRMGSSYVARRYVPPKLVHGASTTARLVRMMNVRPDLRRPADRSKRGPCAGDEPDEPRTDG
jgi:ATP-dependent Clp protease ATP-binding subunit ClpA